MKANKTVIITGGNSGLGFECAKAIAHAHEGWHIVLACRNNEKGMQALDLITSITDNKNLSMLQLDLASLESVRNFVNVYQMKGYPPLKGLICNAGLIVHGGNPVTEEGFELTFGVNHLGHFLLTNLLLNQFVEPGRIVSVSSNTHNSGVREGQMAPATYLGAKKLAYPDTDQELSRMQKYTTSKLCNILFAYELDRKLRKEEINITVNAYDPGFSPGTNLGGDGMSGMTVDRKMFEKMGIVTSTPEDSGKAMARLLLDPQLEKVSGKYFQILEEISSSEESYDEEKAKELWESSKELTSFQESNTQNSN
ncbi:MAG: SDR family NAD(P)-dependent oxidoreductase [Candidatus Lokiarchaeota archaeon]|nr:SDR family NAD(P)-dependent oxidoreductase [Candidatus Lokiarchaeota archaeon]